MLNSLKYLHSHDIVHRNLHAKNIQISSEGTVKLSAYGLYYMTSFGSLISFPIG